MKCQPKKIISSFAALTLLLSLSSCVGGSDEGRLAPVIHYGSESGAGSSGVHTVISGENLWRISKNYAVPMQEIIIKNKLNSPFVLGVGERLLMPPPREYKVQAGDTVFEIARLFSLSQSQLVRLNNLRAPYTIRSGQVLKLPSAYDQERIQKPLAKNKEQFAYTSVPAARPNSAAHETPKKRKKQGSRYIKTKIPARSGDKFSWPVKGKVISRYGSKAGGLYNDGINIVAARGAKVSAAENGVVVYTGDEIKGYGNLVLVKHLNGWVSAYAHLDRIKVKRGMKINKGELLGTVGSTGSVSTPQLHFELRKGAQTKNPIGLLS